MDSIVEALLRKDEKIETAIMFGRSKFQAGVLIMPSKDFAFYPKDLIKLAEFRNAIWFVVSEQDRLSILTLSNCRETVQRANEFAPQHSKILKEVCLSPLYHIRRLNKCLLS
jgi:hypothetical protein